MTLWERLRALADALEREDPPDEAVALELRALANQGERDEAHMDTRFR